MKPVSAPNPILGIAAAASAAVIIAGFAIHATFGGRLWPSESLHTSIEAASALIGLLAAWHLLTLPAGDARAPSQALGLGFLAIGVLDTFQSVVARPDTVVALRSAACVAGALGFAAVWAVPTRSPLTGRTVLRLGTGVAALALTLGAWIVLAPPPTGTFTQSGTFTLLPRLAHVGAAVLYLTGSARLAAAWRDERRPDDFLFATAGALLATAALWFPFSAIWSGTWWYWHVLRFGATLLLLAHLAHARNRTLAGYRAALAARMQAEGALKTSHDHLSRLLESAPIALFTARLEGPPTTLWISANIERLTGFPPERFLATPGFWASRLHPEDADRTLAELDLIRSRGWGTIEYRWQHANGAWLSLLDQITRGSNDDACLCGSCMDVTSHRSLQQAFRQAQKLEAVGRLAGGVAHDFNNLLTVINGYSQLLLAGLPPDHSSREPLDEIRRAGERAAGLTRQLLAFSRKQPARPQILEVDPAIAAVEKMLRRLIGEDIRLVVQAAAGSARIKADPGHVEQVLMNLAVNARDAMPGGGTLTIETAVIDVDAARAARHPDAHPGRHVAVVVTDTGCGMTPEILQHLFEPFFTTKEQGKGTGLGLSTVYGIVTQTGGFVEVESEVDRGSTFRIVLPCTGETAAPAADAAAGPDGRGTETILLAEDQDDVRKFARGLLEARGYTVLEARDGTEAAALSDAHRGPIHLLLTDMVMPRMDGHELGARLTARRPSLAVVYMSGHTTDTLTSRGLDGTGTEFLQKPFAPDALLWLVRAALDRGAGSAPDKEAG